MTLKPPTSSGDKLFMKLEMKHRCLHHKVIVSDPFNINAYAKYSIKSSFVCDLDLNIMTWGKDGTVLN